MQLTCGMYGEGDFFTMKGLVETLMAKMGLQDIAVYDPQAGKSFLHPGRQAKVLYKGREIAYLGEVHPQVLDNFSIGQKAYLAVVDMETLSEFASFDVKYAGVPKFPSMTRDISLSMRKEVLAGQVEEIIRSKGGKLLESYELFDIYEGSQITQGYKSMAYKIVFRATDRTLTDEEVAKTMEKIVKALEEKEVVLRS
jgi:phenylalanyl-tRNA synthetase beta chain